MDLKGKSALVTGASRGIGRSIAITFAEHGATVMVHYHENQEQAEQTLNHLAGGPHVMLRADLADPEEARTLVNDAVEACGRLNVLVNNAGIYERHPVLEAGYETWQNAWRRTLDIDLVGPANLCYLAGRHMAERGGGRIINISSRGAFRGEPDAVSYGAAKAGLNAMSQSLAQALAPRNVFVYVVAPGFVETDMTESLLAGPEGDAIRRQSPLNRAAKPEEVARAVLFLAGGDMDYMTGSILDVNGASYLRS